MQVSDLTVIAFHTDFDQATIALGYGVVADIATPAERGEFVSGMVLG